MHRLPSPRRGGGAFASGSRGATILAAFVFTALLAGMAIAIEIGNVNDRSQLAQAAEPRVVLPAPPRTPQPPVGEQSACKSGERYTVTAADASKGTKKSLKRDAALCDGKTGDDLARCQQQNPKCDVSYCDPDGKNCHTISFDPKTQSAQVWKALGSNDLKDFASKTNKDDLAVLLAGMTPTQRQNILPNLGLSPQESQGLLNAFETRPGAMFDPQDLARTYAACTGADAATCDSTDVKKLNDFEKELKRYADACNGGNAATCDPSDVRRLEQLKTQDELNKYTAACAGPNAANCDSTDIRKLEDLQKRLTPPSTQPPPSTGGCPPGSPGTYPQCNGTFTPPPTVPPPQAPPYHGPGDTGSILDKLKGLGSGGLGGLGSFLNGLGKGLGGGGAGGGGRGGTPQQPPPAQCSTDPTVYQQQREQYQQALQQYNYQLQQYNYQQQQNRYNNYYYGSDYPQPPAPLQPSPCAPATGQQCRAEPPQPPASSCTVGYWKALYSGVCVSSWQCTPNGNSGANPQAQLSCEPKVADVGTSLAISYSCSSGTATGEGFDTGGAQSGSATAAVGKPPPGVTTATYRLSCSDQGKTAGAQCSVQVAKNAIILVANPKSVKQGGTSVIGWITGGMQSCVISSPDDPDFTSRNAANTSPNGAATSSPITKTTNFLLRCETIGGGTKDAPTAVQVK